MGTGGRVTLAFLFKGQFALLVVILVLPTTSIFSTLKGESVSPSCGCEGARWERASYFSLILGHIDLFCLFLEFLKYF